MNEGKPMLRVIQDGKTLALIGNAEGFKVIRDIICDRNNGGKAYAERFVTETGAQLIVVGYCCEDPVVEQFEMDGEVIGEAIQELIDSDATRNVVIVETAYATGDACPDCGKAMFYEDGERMSRDHLGKAPGIFCGDCGTEFPVDWSRVAADG